MTTGENIKRIRKEKGMTQKELGERLNMTQSAVGQFENDRTSPKKDTIEKTAFALGVKPSELMKGDSIWEALQRKNLKNCKLRQKKPLKGNFKRKL